MEEFLSALAYWWKKAQRNNGKTKKEQLEDMDRDIDYEDIELEEEKEKEESEGQRQG